jgi:pimeloyl-ACP methyl ester carboxylesterase
MKPWQKRIAIGLGSLIALLIVAGAIFEAIVRQQIAQKYPVPGKLVDIGDRKIQIDCRGSGSPTVVLEAGLDSYGSLSWAKVHDSLAQPPGTGIAQTTRVCAYSRAGILWSDPAPGDFDRKRTAQDLHAALTKAGELTPWVMVGHSLGGPHIMTFTSLYDQEVAGLVFVDASHPDQIERFHQVIGNAIDEVPLTMKTPPILAEIGSQSGIVRLMNLCVPTKNAPPIANRASCDYLPQAASSSLKAFQSADTTLITAGNFRQLGDRPLVVLTAIWKPTPDEMKAAGVSREQVTQIQDLWKQLQADEASWSSHSRQEIVTDSTHYIQFDRPDVVIKAVREVVNDVRKRNVEINK